MKTVYLFTLILGFPGFCRKKNRRFCS